MGRGGTEAAREAADIVLVDDAFPTIVAAIREGRRISDNVRKVVAFLLSANLGEVLLFAIAVLAGFGAPIAVARCWSSTCSPTASPPSRSRATRRHPGACSGHLERAVRSSQEE